MCRASDFVNAFVESRLVSAVIIADQFAPPGSEECSRMFAGTAVGKVVENWGRCIRPQVSAVGLSLAGTEHLHRRFIGMQYRLPQHFSMQRVDKGLQVHAARADPRAKGRLRYGEPGSGKDGFLSVQVQMINVFGNEDPGQ
jgi:hypothetical protein